MVRGMNKKEDNQICELHWVNNKKDAELYVNNLNIELEELQKENTQDEEFDYQLADQDPYYISEVDFIRSWFHEQQTRW